MNKNTSRQFFVSSLQLLKSNFYCFSKDCHRSQIEVSGVCQDCPIDQIPNDDGIACQECPAGQVSNLGKALCEICPLNQIEVDGICQDCPVGQAPNDDRISCHVKMPCPNDCTSSDHGDCDTKTGTCNCKEGFTFENCAGELSIIKKNQWQL